MGAELICNVNGRLENNPATDTLSLRRAGMLKELNRYELTVGGRLDQQHV